MNMKSKLQTRIAFLVPRHRRAALLRVATAASLLGFSAVAWAIPDHITVPATNPWTQQSITFSLDRYNLRGTNYQVRLYTDQTNYTLLPTNQIPEVTTFRGSILEDPAAAVSAGIRPNGNMFVQVAYGCRDTAQSWGPGQTDPYDGTNRFGWATDVMTTNVPSLGYANVGVAYVALANAPTPVPGPASGTWYNNLGAVTNFGGPVTLNNTWRLPTVRAQVLCGVAPSVFNDFGRDTSYAILAHESVINTVDFFHARDAGSCYQILSEAIMLYTNTESDPVFSNLPGSYQRYNVLRDVGGGTASLGGWWSQCSYEDMFGLADTHEMGHNLGMYDLVGAFDYMGTSQHTSHTGSGRGHGTCELTEALYTEAVTWQPQEEWVLYRSPMAPRAMADFASTPMNTPVSMDVLQNDRDPNSTNRATLGVASFEPVSQQGGTVTNLGFGWLRYSPAAGFRGDDLFHYYLTNASGMKSLTGVRVLVVDTNNPLIAQYKFDETNGTVAADSSGCGRSGALQNANFATASVPGVGGSRALHFDGSSTWVNFQPSAPYSYDAMDQSQTISLWFKLDAAPTGQQMLYLKNSYCGYEGGLWLGLNSSSIFAQAGTYGHVTSLSAYAPLTPLPGKWYHVVAQVDRASNLLRLWVNALEYTSTYNTRNIPANEFIVGEISGCVGIERRYYTAGSYFRGAMQDLRVYTKALTQTEINNLFSAGGLLPATGPSPADGDWGVVLQPALTWSPGRTNYQHDLYLGTNAAALANATTSSAEYRGRLAVASYTPPASLLANTTYYWRVDEVDGGTNFVTGLVWSFTTAVDAMHGGLKLHLTLDRRDTLGTNTFDRSGWGNNGILTSSPAAITGAVSDALNFNGTNSYVTLSNPPSLNFSGPITISAWVKPATSSATQSVIEHGYIRSPNEEVGLRIDGGYYEIFSWDGTTHLAQYPVPAGDLNNWVHLVGEYDGASWRLFRNGVQVAQTTDAVGSIPVSANWCIGSVASGTERFFQGGIDDVMMWNRALSAGEVYSIYTNGLAGNSIDAAGLAITNGLVWTGASDPYWTTASNWLTNAVPGTNDTAIFDYSAMKIAATDIGQPMSVAGLLLNGPLLTVGIGSAASNTLTLGASGVALSNVAANVTLNLTTPVALGVAQTWSVPSAASLTVNGSLSGGAALTKTGAGSLAFAGANTCSGATTVSNGTLALQNTYASSSFSIAPGAVLELNVASGSRDNPAATSFAGAGTLRKTGAGTALWGSAVATFALSGGGLIDVQGGTLVGSSYGNDVWTGNLGSLNIAAGAEFDGVEGNIRVDALTGGGTFKGGYSGYGGSLTLGVNGGSGFFSGTLQDYNASLTVTKTGSGTQILSGACSYSGSTTISGGTLQVNGMLGSGTVTVQSSGTLGGAGSIGGPVTVNGTLALGSTNLGTLTINNALTLNSGSTTVMRVAKSGSAAVCDQVTGSGDTSSVTYGGTLTIVSNASTGAFQAGDKFYLFSGSGYFRSGAFSSFNLPVLGSGLGWDTTGLAVDGSIQVINQVGAPQFSPPPGIYGAAVSVTITSDPGATIYYTTNGAMPTPGSAVYSAPITVPANSTMAIRAYATKAGSTDSTVGSGVYATIGAAMRTWTNLAGGSWTNTANWTNGVVADGTGVTADFSTLDLNSDATVALDGARTIGNLVFGDSAPDHSWTLNPGAGGPLTLSAAGSPLIMVNNQTATIAVTLAGTQGLTKTGFGTLALTGTNTYTGATTNNVGTMRVTDLSSYRSSTVIASGATFEAGVAANVNATNSFNLTGTGTLVKTGPGTWQIGNVGRVGISLSPGGLVDIREGIIQSGNHQNGWTGNQGSVNVAAGATIDLPAENLWADALTGGGSIIMTYGASGGRTVYVGVANGSGTFSGSIGSGGLLALNKSGTGTQILSGNNTYTAATTVGAGTLLVNGSLAAGSAVTVNAGATLGGTGTVAGSVAVSGTIAPGSSSVSALNTGAETWNGGGSYLCNVVSTNSAGSDLLNITGTLTVAASAGSPFTVKLASLTAANQPGWLAGFDPSRNYSWTIATASGGVSGFSAANVLLNTSGFSNVLTGTFTLTNLGNNLTLTYTGVPLAPVITGRAMLPNGSFQLTFTGPPGQSFSVRAASLVTAPLSAWAVLTNGVIGVNGSVIFTDPAASANPQQFYRITSPWP
jgi:autotransporter-associated beta strand protein